MNFEVGDIVEIKNNNTSYRFFFIGEKDLLKRSYILYPLQKIIGPPTEYFCEIWGFKINRLILIRTAESINFEDKNTSKTLREIFLDTIEICSKYTKTPSHYKERNFKSTYYPKYEELNKNIQWERTFTEMNLNHEEVQKSFIKIEDSLNKIKDGLNNIKEEQKMLKILELYENKQSQLIRKDYYSKMEEIQKNDVVSIIIEEMKKQLEAVIPEKMEKIEIAQDLYSDETDKLLEELEKEKDKKLDELHQKIQDIKALLELAPDYQESLKILRDYEIIDKKKNVLL